MKHRHFILAIFFLPPLLLSAAFYRHTVTEVLARETRVTIEKGKHLPEIAALLEEKGILRKAGWFRFYVRLRGESENLKAGRYRFNYFNSPAQVLDKLLAGKIDPIAVRVIEGWTVRQIASTLGEHPEIDGAANFAKTFEALAFDKAFVRSLGFNADSLEGYLFPETYFMPPDATPADYLATFSGEFRKKYGELTAQFSTPPKMTQHQIVTFASIVEKETSFPGERPYVASVFFNRLRKGMLLQADPTIIYGLKNFDGNLRKSDLLNPHPYNTYVHAGLPPGPISNPSYRALRATLNPARTDYFYFVANRAGSHQFSKTHDEHLAAVRKFQLKK